MINSIISYIKKEIGGEKRRQEKTEGDRKRQKKTGKNEKKQ